MLSRSRSQSQATTRFQDPIYDDYGDSQGFNPAGEHHHHSQPASPRVVSYADGRGAARLRRENQDLYLSQGSSRADSSTGSLENFPGINGDTGQDLCQEEVDLENALRHASNLLDGLITPGAPTQRSCRSTDGGGGGGGGGGVLRARRGVANQGPSSVLAAAAAALVTSRTRQGAGRRDVNPEDGGNDSDGEDGSLHVPHHRHHLQGDSAHSHGAATAAGDGTSGSDEGVNGSKPSFLRNQRRLSWIDGQATEPVTIESPFAQYNNLPGGKVGGGRLSAAEAATGNSNHEARISDAYSVDSPGHPAWVGSDGQIRRSDTNLRHWAYAGERRVVDQEVVQTLSQHVFAYDLKGGCGAGYFKLLVRPIKLEVLRTQGRCKNK